MRKHFPTLFPALFLIVFAGFMTFLVAPDTISDACAAFVFFSFFPLMGIALTHD